jgi:hypothetical protein
MFDCRRGWIALLVLLVAALLLGGDLRLRAETAPAAPPLAFDIPAEDVDKALKELAEVSGLQILFESAIITGRHSTAVNGVMTPEAALSILLLGSGLVSRRSDVDAIVVVPEPASLPAGPDASFLGALQSSILRGLCREPQTRPGAYHIAFQLWMAQNGTVRRTTLLGSTGDPHRDAAVIRALKTVVVGAVPTDAAERPLTMTISKGASPVGMMCGG